jgi:hypothetical protein
MIMQRVCRVLKLCSFISPLPLHNRSAPSCSSGIWSALVGSKSIDVWLCLGGFILYDATRFYLSGCCVGGSVEFCLKLKGYSCQVVY